MVQSEDDKCRSQENDVKACKPDDANFRERR